MHAPHWRPRRAIAGRAALAAPLVLAVTGCSGGGSGDAPTPPTATTAALTTVAVTPASSTLALGDPVTFAATPAFGTGAAPAVSLVWSRRGSAGGTVTADATGLTAAYASAAGAVGVDTVTVTATAASGPSAGTPVVATAVLEVRGPRVVRVVYPAHAAYLGVGGTFALAAVGRDGAGAAVPKAVVTYQSLTPGVVSVGPDGTLTGVSAGPAVVVATASTVGTSLPADTLRVTVDAGAGVPGLALVDTVVRGGRAFTLIGAALGAGTITLGGQPVSASGTSDAGGGLTAITVSPAAALFATCHPLGSTVALAVAGRTMPVALFAPQVVSLAVGASQRVTAAAAAGCPVAVDQAGTYVAMPYVWDAQVGQGGSAGVGTPPAGSPTPIVVTTGAPSDATGVSASRAPATAVLAVRTVTLPSGGPRRAGRRALPSDVVLLSAPRAARGTATAIASYPPSWTGGSCPIPTVVGDSMTVGTWRTAAGRFLQPAATADVGGLGVNEAWQLAALRPSVAVFVDSALARAKGGLAGYQGRMDAFADAYEATVTPLLAANTTGVPDADGNGRVVVFVALHASNNLSFPSGYARMDCVNRGVLGGEAIVMGGEAFVGADHTVAPAVSVAAHETSHLVDNYTYSLGRQDTWWSREGYAVLLQYLWALPADQVAGALTAGRTSVAYRTVYGTAQGSFCERPDRAVLQTWYTLSGDGYPLACQAVRYALSQLARQQPGLATKDLLTRWSQLRDRRHLTDALNGLLGGTPLANRAPADAFGSWALSWVADGVASAAPETQDYAADVPGFAKVWYPQLAVPTATLSVGQRLTATLGEPDALHVQVALPSGGWVAVAGANGAGLPTDRADLVLFRVR